jgi:hypothetical protein
MGRKWVFLAPLAILAILLFIAIGGAVVQLLWNWLTPSIFGWRAITFGQALGILALCRILFGGVGGHGSGRSHVHRRLSERLSARVAERGEHMTPEERERFRQRVRERCGFGPPAGERKGQ